MQLDNFLYVQIYAVMQICLDKGYTVHKMHKHRIRLIKSFEINEHINRYIYLRNMLIGLDDLILILMHFVCYSSYV